MSRGVRSSGFSAENLTRIIELCRDVAAKGVNPFEVDVGRYLETLQQHLSSWNNWKELILDSAALNALSSIIKLQWEWIKHEASTMNVDPALMELSIRIAEPRALANAFLKSWHPILSVSQIGRRRLIEALDYWNLLLPLNQRITSMPSLTQLNVSSITLDELVKLRVLSDEEFEYRISELLDELQQRFQQKVDKVDYWDFIRGRNAEETFVRGYLTSFLVTSGKAGLSIDPIQEKISITQGNSENLQRKSVAIAVDRALNS